MRVAVCLAGAVSRVNAGHLAKKGEIYSNKNPYVNLECVQRGLQKHLVDVNPAASFDFFVHSWCQDLEAELTALYHPLASLYEDNRLFEREIESRLGGNAFGYVSLTLSRCKVLRLVNEAQHDYDVVIVCRPDVLLYSDMALTSYDVDRHIYVNRSCVADATIEAVRGSFHFVMSASVARQFSTMFDVRPNIDARTFINKYMPVTLRADDIMCARDQEVVRKLHLGAIERMKYPLKKFEAYGVSAEYMQRLRHDGR